MNNVAKSQNIFKKVMIIDDHPLYSVALGDLIKLELGTTHVHVASSLEDASKLFSKRVIPKLIFLDLNLPDATGMSGLVLMRQRLSDVPVIVISATSNANIVEAAIGAGASGFICKNISREELVDQLKRLGKGESVFPHFVKERPGVRSELSDISQKLAKLTPQQTRILQMICQGKLNKQIAYELNLAEATVKTHMTAMMRKLSVQNRTQAALLIRDATLVADLQ